MQASALNFDSEVTERFVLALANQQEFLGASCQEGEKVARQLLTDRTPPQVVTNSPTKYCIEDLWHVFSTRLNALQA
jgi:hypothetical protein